MVHTHTSERSEVNDNVKPENLGILYNYYNTINGWTLAPYSKMATCTWWHHKMQTSKFSGETTYDFTKHTHELVSRACDLKHGRYIY